jgi:hypothetical protein
LLNEYERQLAELRRELVAAKSMPPLQPMSKDPSASEMSELVREYTLRATNRKPASESTLYVRTSRKPDTENIPYVRPIGSHTLRIHAT